MKLQLLINKKNKVIKLWTRRMFVVLFFKFWLFKIIVYFIYIIISISIVILIFCINIYRWHYFWILNHCVMIDSHCTFFGYNFDMLVLNVDFVWVVHF